MAWTDAIAFPGIFTEEDWKEDTDVSSPSQVAITRGDSYATVRGRLPWPKLKSAIKYFLGYSWVEGSQLRRELPAFHPWLNWLWCTRIVSITGEGAPGGSTPELEGGWPAGTPYKRESQYLDGLPFTQYEWAVLEVAFEQLPYPLKGDASVSNEWERYTYLEEKEDSYNYEIDGGQFKFQAPSVAEVDGKVFPGNRVIAYRDVVTFTLSWHEVDRKFTHGDGYYAPAFLKAKNKVNSEEFLGFPAGTLLLKEIKKTRKTQPVATDELEELSYHDTYEFTLLYTDPPRGDEAVDVRGWNLFPWRDMKWYYAVSTVGGTDYPLYPGYDFAKLFKHHSLA